MGVLPPGCGAHTPPQTQRHAPNPDLSPGLGAKARTARAFFLGALPGAAVVYLHGLLSSRRGPRLWEAARAVSASYSLWLRCARLAWGPRPASRQGGILPLVPG